MKKEEKIGRKEYSVRLEEKSRKTMRKQFEYSIKEIRNTDDLQDSQAAKNVPSW